MCLCARFISTSSYKTKPVQVVNLNGFEVGSTGRLAIREILRGIGLHSGFEREKRKREKRNCFCYGFCFALVYHLLMAL